MTDFDPGASLTVSTSGLYRWAKFGRNLGCYILVVLYRRFYRNTHNAPGPLCENMTSSTEPEVHIVGGLWLHSAAESANWHVTRQFGVFISASQNRPGSYSIMWSRILLRKNQWDVGNCARILHFATACVQRLACRSISASFELFVVHLLYQFAGEYIWSYTAGALHVISPYRASDAAVSAVSFGKLTQTTMRAGRCSILTQKLERLRSGECDVPQGLSRPNEIAKAVRPPIINHIPCITTV